MKGRESLFLAKAEKKKKMFTPFLTMGGEKKAVKHF